MKIACYSIIKWKSIKSKSGRTTWLWGHKKYMEIIIHFMVYLPGEEEDEDDEKDERKYPEAARLIIFDFY